MQIENQNIPILILAAGSSSRLGRSKQLLEFNEQKLINYIIDQAVKSQSGNVYVVLGGNFSEIRNVIEDPNIKIIENKDWETGMSTSIKAGIHFILDCEKHVNAIMILLCDQIQVNSELFMHMKAQYIQDKISILCCQYDDDNYGPPTIFGREYIDDLLALIGHSGAKKIIDKNINNVKFYPFNLGSIDIDTESDVQKWM